jgi:outer membrane lipoprotein-sorting protein
MLAPAISCPKGIKTVFLTLLLFSTAFVQAIPPLAGLISEGKVNYKVDANSLDPAVAQFLQNLSMVVYFSGDKLRVDMNLGLLGTTSTISDGKTGKTLTLMNMMGNKLAVNEMPEEAKELQWTVENTGATKTIAGHECRKTLLKTDQVNLVYYVTDRIASPKIKSEFQLDKLDGFPLEMQMKNNGISFTMVATSVLEQAVPASTFSLNIPAGYELMTPEDMLQMLGGMMGQ